MAPESALTCAPNADQLVFDPGNPARYFNQMHCVPYMYIRHWHLLMDAYNGEKKQNCAEFELAHQNGCPANGSELQTGTMGSDRIT